MPKTETVYARLELKSYDQHFVLNETASDINKRLYDVMTDDFYLKKLTDIVAKHQPNDLEPWLEYKKRPRLDNQPETINAIAKFQVTDQRVDLVEIRFH